MTTHHVAPELELAGLDAIEATVSIAARALRTSYPAINQLAHPSDSIETVAARALVDACVSLLLAVDDHRTRVVARIPEWARGGYDRSF